MRFRSAVITALASLWLQACATPTPPSARDLLAGVTPTPVLLVGEQHDAPEHQALQRELLLALADQGRLAAVVMEMADAGRDTQGLPPGATEAQVRAALGWTDDTGWPWPTYRPVVMAAVQAGVPVFGGNLPRSSMRSAMSDVALDASVPADVLARQREAIREGHCDLLPASQLAPMARIQLARDRSLAAVAAARTRPGATVLLIAGNGHVRRDLGVPLHLGSRTAHRVVVARAGSAGADAVADAYWDTPALPAKDHCAELHERFKR